MTDAGTPPADPDGVPGELIRRPFDRSGITDLRHAVAHCAAAAGLAGQALDDFVLVVNELATNAVRHGGGQGRLRLWRADGRIFCEIADRGSGIAAGSASGLDRPPPLSAGGWGLWLAHQLSDHLSVSTSPGGTTVQISAATTTAECGAGPSTSE
ncbi:MAG TPA: ATP-binding protein [Pilimelia sp.]|nr:ATP-binding protein [Pilimelia sp.]